MSDRVREARPLVELGFVAAKDMEDLERLVPKLERAEARGLTPWQGFEPRLLLRAHVGAAQLVGILSGWAGGLAFGAARATFMPRVQAGLLAGDPALIAGLEALTPAATKAIGEPCTLG